MAKAGDVTIELRAKTAQFNRDMLKAKGGVSEFAGKAKAAAKSALGLGDSVSQTGKAMRTLAGLAATAISAAMIKRTIDAGDKFNKLSDRLGISTEALSELKYAAEITGVSFEQMTMATQRSTRRIAEAAQGMGEAKGALQELNLDAKELNSLSPDKQMEVLADALAGVGSQSDRVRLAMKLFDSEGVALLQTLKGGSEGLKEMRAQANALGLTITQDMADKMTAAADELLKFQKAGEGLTNTIVIGILPAVTDLTRGINDLFMGASNSSKTLNELALGMASVANAVGFISDKDLEFMADEALDNIRKGEQSLARAAVSAEKVGKASAGGGIDKAAQDAQKLAQSLDDMQKQTSRDVYTHGMNELASKLHEVDFLVSDLATRYNTELTPAQTAQIETIKENITTLDALEKAQESQRELANELSGAFNDAFESGIEGAESFGDVLDELGKQIQRILMRQLITKPLNDAISGAFSGGGGDLLGGLGGLFGFRANGGAVQAGQPYIVGEKRPEVFVPQTGGKIMPSTSGMGGGTNVAVNIINNSGARASASERMVGNTRTIEVMIDEAVAANAKRQGSQTNRALSGFNSNTIIGR